MANISWNSIHSLKGCSRLYFKTPNNQKILRKSQKINNLLKTKRIQNMKYKLMGRPVFHVACQVGRFFPLPAVSYATACVTLKSHTSVWCVTVCPSEQYQTTYSYHYKVPFPPPQGGFCGLIPPKQNVKPP